MTSAAGTSRRTFVHVATLVMDPGGDVRAPGAAITRRLCGSTSHDPPCPLAPHHTAADGAGAEVRLRVLFAADPADGNRVRQLVDEALAGGALTGPDGARTSWRLVDSGPGTVHPGEEEHGRRLARG